MFHGSSYFLRHQQFGHASSHSLSPIFQKLSFLWDHNLCCDFCHRVKKTRLSSPLSLRGANKAFDLIHGDVWGSYRKASLSPHGERNPPLSSKLYVSRVTI